MKSRIALLSLLLGLFVLTAALPAAEPEYKSPVAKLELQDGDSIVFLGDSITHQCLYTQYVEDFFYTRYPGMRLRFHNSGVGGAKAWDALQRFDRDVAAYKPKYVTVLLGMNDGRYQPYNEEIFQTYRTDMTEVIARIEKIGATPVLMTPTMFDSRAARMSQRKRDPESLALYNSVLAYYGAWLREVAVEGGFGFVDMYSPLNNLTLKARKTNPEFTMIRDSVHPDPPGQLVMAYAMIDQLGLHGPVSSIRVSIGEDELRVQGAGGKASDVGPSDGGLSFTWQADSLPFVLPEEARPGAKLLKLGHRMSREALAVHGIPAGRYELKIDGQSVGTYTARQLARHIELQRNTATPQYQQALAVAELNKKRNDGPVKSLRNEWRAFQQHARLAAQLQQTPDNAQLKEQVAKLAKVLEGQAQRIEQHEQAALELEDKIFEINQPQPRKYVLTRVGESVSKSPVSGTVTLDGLPLANAKIALHSKQKVVAAGTTDKAGSYTLNSKGRAGVPVGSYAVTVSKDGLPEKYSSREKSGLTVDVIDGANRFDFELRSQ